jgi:hypothetical protein
MNKARTGKASERGAPIEDPAAIREVLQALAEAETEFFIKVEGTATLPYAAWVQSLRLDEGRVVLKLVRPLPHEMPAGALFQMTFAAGEQRFEGTLALVGREAYLQYGFQSPSQLFLADRRRHKRYPFRPRENAYVTLQDAGIPGLAVAGPLVNIGMGGMALRVDRVLHLDDGMRVPVASALFERGKAFPRFRVQDLPRLPQLEGRALCAHATERGSELLLGVGFPGLDPDPATALAQSLQIRETMYRGGTASRPEGEPGAARAIRAPGDPVPGGAPEAGPAGDDAATEAMVLLRLRRRAARVVLVMAAGPARQNLEDLLRDQGYARLETAADLDQLPSRCDPGQRRALPALVLVDLALARSGDAEPLAAARVIEGRLSALGERPAAILCEEVDPTLLLAPEARTRFLPYPAGDPGAWVAALDALIT